MTRTTAFWLCAAIALVSAPSVVPLSAGDVSEGHTGIARGYLQDEGIENHPSVIFSESFEADASSYIAQWSSSSTVALSRASDAPEASGGTSSCRMEAIGISGTLYKQLSQDYEKLFYRYYVKYEGSDYHHTGASLGGYLPPTPYPQGDAGIKGIRSNGDRLIYISFEEQDSERLDFYSNWVDMKGIAWQGLYYGRNFLEADSLTLESDRWICVEIMIAMNSAPAVADGELAIWLDGELVRHFEPGQPKGTWQTGGSWISDPEGPEFEGFLWRDTLDYGLNWVKIQNYDAEPFVWFDDLVVSTEYIGPINTEPVSDPSDADFDESGRVDFQDFLLFAGQFGRRSSHPEFDDHYDLDDDGRVGFTDFLLFGASFGRRFPVG